MMLFDIVYLAIIGVAAFFVWTYLHPGAVDPQIFRSRQQRMIAGVFGGLAARFGVAPLWLRLAYLALVAIAGPARFQALALYAVAWAITPLAAPVRTWTIEE